MKYAFLIASFDALFFTLLLFQKKRRNLHDNILICWLIYLGLFIGTYAFSSHELFTNYKLLSISLLSLFMLHGPFLYLYVTTLVSGRQKLNLRDLFHLAPLILFSIYIIISSFNTETSLKLNIEKLSSENEPPFLFVFFLILTAASGTIYFLLTFSLFRKLDINIFNNYSSFSGINPAWLRILVLIFGVVWTILIIITVIHHIFGMFSMVFCTDGLFLSLSVFVILAGYFGLKQKVIFSAGEMIVASGNRAQGTKYAGSRLTYQEAREYAEKLTVYMKSEKPHLDPDLTLPKLASGLSVSVHYLSQVINEQFNLNFFDFINRYRVESFKEKIADPQYNQYSLLGLAFECGFNSKSAFNRIFRQVTGMTPSEYRKAI